MIIGKDLTNKMINLSFEYPGPRPSPHKGKYLMLLKKFKEKSLSFKSITTSSDSNITHFINSSLSNKIIRYLLVFILSLIFLITLLSFHKHSSIALILPISIILSILVTLAFISSLKLRCILFLSLPHLFSTHGRIVLLSVVSTITIGGPLLSLGHNLNEAGMSFSCITNMTETQGRALFDAYAKSYEDISEFLEARLEGLNKTKLYLDKIFEPILKPISEFEQLIDRIERTMIETVKNCKSVIGQAREDCFARANTAFKKCRAVRVFNMIPIPTDVCDLVFISTDVCDPLVKPKVMCYPVDLALSIGPEIKIWLESIKKELLIQVVFERSIQQSFSNSLNRTQIKEEIKSSFMSQFNFFITFVEVVQIILLGSVLWIPFKSWLFMRSFKKKRKRSTLRAQIYAEKERQKYFCSQTIIIIAHLFATLMIFVLDFICYWALHISKTSTHSQNATMSASNEIVLSLNVSRGLAFGESFDYNMKRNHGFLASSNMCLPNLNPPSSLGPLFGIFMIYGLIIILVVFSNRVLKLRPKILDYFYPG